MPSSKVSVTYTVSVKGPLSDKAEAAMGRAIEAAVKASGILTMDKPANAKVPHWNVEMRVTLAPDKEGKMLQGTLTGEVLAVGAAATAGKLAGTSATEITGKDHKPNAGDVQALAEDLGAKAIQKSAIPYMKSHPL